MFSTRKRLPAIAVIAAFALTSLFLTACGGGAGGEAAGRGLILLSFSQDSVDNVVLNQRLRFDFSGNLDPASITSASIQIRQGDQFGLTVPGAFIVSGSTVIFEPVLAALCDQSDSGLKPDTEYRVQVIGFPEEFSIRNIAGQPLASTQTFQFHTRLDTDPTKYSDQIPGAGPTVVTTTPADGAQAVKVEAGNSIEIVLSENIDPCTVTDENIIVTMYESGDPGTMAPVPGTSPTRFSGFLRTPPGSTADQTPADPFTWGADGTTSYAANPRRILCDIKLEQDFSSVKLVLTPLLGFNPDPLKNASRFPENALIVVQLTFDILDYGQQPMIPHVFAFTTENLSSNTGEYTIENKGETQYDKSLTTAAVHPDARAPERVQGYMLFAGDGDNGASDTDPSLPNVTPACLFPLQPNSGSKNDFDPAGDVILDTGSTFNTCPNDTDGSTAVVWEFSTFRVRSGVTVRIVGVNPAIILVQGDAVIDSGARVLVRGDGTAGVPRGDGQDGGAYQSGNGNGTQDRLGGVGVAGGGNGGRSENANQNWRFGDDGNPGFGSADFNPAMPRLSPNTSGVPAPLEGGGAAGQPMGATTSSPWDGAAAGGGGGGHADPGLDGERNDPGTNYKLKLVPRSQGGTAYEAAGNSGDKLQTPEAGSGGGAGGLNNARTFSNSTTYVASGGAGGAGGGFLDITSSGDIVVSGTLDAAGGTGGDGAVWTTNARNASGGGGGGSGGGIRLLTPNDIILGATAIVSAAGGAGGTGAQPQTNGAAAQNDGGDGGNGRIVMETSNGLITGLGGAAVTPSEGETGFYRGLFDAARFQGGGLTPSATSELIVLGNYAGFDPTFDEATAAHFKCGVPVAGSPGAGNVALLVEARGVQMLPDGTPDLGSATDFVSICYFEDSGVETSPDFNLGHPGTVPVPADNTGGPGGFTELNGLAAGDGFEFLQVRFTIFLPATVGPFDAGAYLDDWTIHFSHNQ